MDMLDILASFSSKARFSLDTIVNMSIHQKIRQGRLKLGMTEQQFGDAVGVSRGAVQQWEKENGTAPTRKNQPAVAKLLGMSVSELVDDSSDSITPKRDEDIKKNYAGSTLTPILSWEHESDLPQGEYVFIPRLDIHLSAGNGREQIDVDFDKRLPQAFRAEWLREKKLSPNKLASMTVDGESMEPLLFHGDAVVVDTAQNTIRDGRVYALWYDGGERIKRLWSLPGGGIRIKSDNPQHQSIDVTGEQAGNVRVIGRIVHKQGDGGL